jgi:hypothetical protein
MDPARVDRGRMPLANCQLSRRSALRAGAVLAAPSVLAAGLARTTAAQEAIPAPDLSSRSAWRRRRRQSPLDLARSWS